jgi:multiple sugar transport system ATP-binding protein
MAGVALDGVSKSYEGITVVRDIALEVADGEFVALVGPSGCGKSTLLRMIAGLEKTSSGTITIGGRDVTDLSPGKRDVAMVFQSYALYPHMTAEQNLTFALKLKKTPGEVIKARVSGAAEMLGISELVDRLPRAMSGGQRQRVAMGRAVVRQPSVFLFDEPLSNLDANLRVKMRAEIKELHQRLKSTAIYVTHDQIEAMTMAARIVVMRSGSVEQIGAPLELYDRPANQFVAGFLGSPAMNFIPGRLDPGGQPHVLSGSGLSLPAGRRETIQPGQQVIYGVRPEHFKLDADGLPLVVKVVEPTGAETYIGGSLGGDDVVAVFRARVFVSPGETIGVSLSPDHAHIFDATTSWRLN